MRLRSFFAQLVLLPILVARFETPVLAASKTTVLEIAASLCGAGAQRVVGNAVGACESEAVLVQLSIVKSEGSDLLTSVLTAKHQRVRTLTWGSCFFPVAQASAGGGGVEYDGFGSNLSFVRPTAPDGTVWKLYVFLPTKGKTLRGAKTLSSYLSEFDRRVKEAGLGAADIAGVSFCQK